MQRQSLPVCWPILPTYLTVGKHTPLLAWWPPALSVAVGDTFDNASGATHASFGAEYNADTSYAAVADKYFQVIYVDAAGKIRGTGDAKIAATIS